MKLVLNIFSIILLVSCGGGASKDGTSKAEVKLGFTKGVKVDAKTKLTVNYNGLSLDDIYLADEKENRLPNNEVVIGSKLAIVATGVNNLVEKNGKVFPGCTIVLTDKNGQPILYIEDAFENMTEGTSVAEAKLLKASLNTGEPMVAGEAYHLNVLFYDKNKKENEIMANVNLLIKG